MVKFNKDIMTKGTINESFILSDGDFAIVADINDSPDDSFTETAIGDEVWVLNQVTCNEYNGREMLLCYFPNLDFATAILKSYVDFK